VSEMLHCLGLVHKLSSVLLGPIYIVGTKCGLYTTCMLNGTLLEAVRGALESKLCSLTLRIRSLTLQMHFYIHKYKCGCREVVYSLTKHPNMDGNLCHKP
jgi:hypothetical protein